MLTYIKIFLTDLEAMEALSDAERGRLLTAMLKYAQTGEVQQLSGNERILYPMLRGRIDRDMAEYDAYIDKQRENGRKGGRPLKATETQGNPKNPPLFSETQKTKDKDKDKDKEEDIFAAYADGELYLALVEFEKMRKKMKAPMTERAKQLLCSKLDKLASTDAEKISLLDKSIVNGWKDVYEQRTEQRQTAKAPLVTSTPGELEFRMLRRMG